MVSEYVIIFSRCVYAGAYEGPVSAVEAPGDGREDRGQA